MSMRIILYIGMDYDKIYKLARRFEKTATDYQAIYNDANSELTMILLDIPGQYNISLEGIGDNVSIILNVTLIAEPGQEAAQEVKFKDALSKSQLFSSTPYKVNVSFRAPTSQRYK